MSTAWQTADRYAVVGHPIDHSRSPFIHTLFARQTGEALAYTAMDVPAQSFTERVNAFRDAGGRGLNVTVPLKELAFEYATHRSPRAARAGAANTLRFDGAEVFACNTDGPGLVRDLEANHDFSLRGRKVLMLGAGGAARGVVGPLLDREPAHLVIANRTEARALALAGQFASDGALAGCSLDAIPRDGFDLVINATATDLTGGTLPLLASHLRPGTLCYDMMYAARPTGFLAQARALGAARLIDGRGMLVEQAAESFFLWRGVRPCTRPVIAALSEALASPLS